MTWSTLPIIQWPLLSRTQVCRWFAPNHYLNCFTFWAWMKLKHPWRQRWGGGSGVVMALMVCTERNCCSWLDFFHQGSPVLCIIATQTAPCLRILWIFDCSARESEKWGTRTLALHNRPFTTCFANCRIQTAPEFVFHIGKQLRM